jgi:hypothetical protein
MAYGFTITTETMPDFTARNWVLNAKVTITTGTYPSGGVGPLGLAALMGIGIQNATPHKSFQESIANPPSGVIYQYDPTTDKLRAFVTGTAAGDVLNEISGTIPGDTVEVQQWFNRGA